MGSVRRVRSALAEAGAEPETHPADMGQCRLCLKDKPDPGPPQVSGAPKHLAAWQFRQLLEVFFWLRPSWPGKRHRSE